MTIATDQKAKLTRRIKNHGSSYLAPPHRAHPFVYLPRYQPIRHRSPAGTERSSGWRMLSISAAILILLALFWAARDPVMSLLTMAKDQESVSAYLNGFGVWGPLVLVLVQLIQVVLAFIPGHVFLVAAGYVYGFVPGLLLNYLSIVIASQLSFSMARWAGRPLVGRLVPKDVLDRWYQMGEQQGFTFFTISFLLPVFPTDVMNFVAGLSGISPLRFLAANMLGRLPGAILLTLIGSHGLQISPLTWGLLGMLVVILYLIGRSVVNGMERRTPLSTSISSD